MSEQALQQQTTPIQTTPTQETTSQEPSKADSERFEQLAKREKAIRTEAKRLQEMKRQYEIAKPVEAPKYDLRAELQKAVEQGSITGDELSQYALSQMSQSPESTMIRQLQAKIAELEGSTKTVQSKFEQSQLQSREIANKNIRRELDQIVGADERFELIKAQNRQDAVMQLINDTYDQDGLVMNTEEAAREMEAYLEEQILPLAKLKKIQAKLASVEVSPQAGEPATKPQQNQKPTITTLSNRVETVTKKSTSEAERRARAFAAFNGQLK